MAAIVVAFALALLTGVEVGSGGLATPAVGALLLMLSVNANAAGGKKDDNCTLNRGRIQAQGEKLEESVAWAQISPVTAAQGLLMLEELKAKLSKKELEIRANAFAKAQRFIENCKLTNGCNAFVTRSFIVDGTKSERVDIEIRAGKAFE